MSEVAEVDVYLDEHGNEPVKVGVLKPSFMGGRNLASSSFQYDPTYLSRPESYPISPDLPLTATRTYTAENQDIFGAFSDASPDQWGQKIIQANHAILRQRDPSLPGSLGAFDFLVGVSDHSRMGALRLKRPGTNEWLSGDSAVANMHDLNRVIAAARRYGIGDDLEGARLAAFSDTHHGAR